LTHGPLQKQTHSGRTAEFWSGALREIENRMRDSCRNLVIRGGRYDLKVPEFVVELLGLNQILEPITSRLATIMVFIDNIYYILIRYRNVCLKIRGRPVLKYERTILVNDKLFTYSVVYILHCKRDI